MEIERRVAEILIDILGACNTALEAVQHSAAPALARSERVGFGRQQPAGNRTFAGTFYGAFDRTFDRTFDGAFDRTFDGTFDGTFDEAFGGAMHRTGMFEVVFHSMFVV